MYIDLKECHTNVTYYWLSRHSLPNSVGRKVRYKRLFWDRDCKAIFIFSDYQGSEGLDGVESLITNVGGRLLMLQKDKAYPERKTRKVNH